MWEVKHGTTIHWYSLIGCYYFSDTIFYVSIISTFINRNLSQEDYKLAFVLWKVYILQVRTSCSINFHSITWLTYLVCGKLLKLARSPGPVHWCQSAWYFLSWTGFVLLPPKPETENENMLWLVQILLFVCNFKLPFSTTFLSSLPTISGTKTAARFSEAKIWGLKSYVIAQEIYRKWV